MNYCFPLSNVLHEENWPIDSAISNTLSTNFCCYEEDKFLFLLEIHLQFLLGEHLYILLFGVHIVLSDVPKYGLLLLLLLLINMLMF